MIKSINPYTGKTISLYKPLTTSELEMRISRGHHTQLTWRETVLSHRCGLMQKVASILKIRERDFAELISAEMGKPITQAEAEVQKCAWLCDYYADHAQQFLNRKVVKTDASESFVAYEPLGVLLGVMPWNYPFWQVFRFAVPAVLSGNTVLLKHASNVMGCSKAIEDIFTDSGFPEGVFQHLQITSEQVELVLTHEHVRGVSLTGSEKAGSAVAGIAGRSIKPSLLELGGSNAFIVMADADLEKALSTAIQARFQNTGQSCIAAKRLLLHEAIADQFLDRFVQEVKNLNCGDPMDENTYIGVMAREDLAESLESQMKRSLDQGAEILCGGSRKGAFFEPTVMRSESPNMPVLQEETFGPLVCAITFSTLDEAIQVSNSTAYGLGVSVFTEGADDILSRIGDFQEGAVFINELVKSDPRLPFGGVKDSGYGRELGQEGILAFVNAKTVYVK